ncbi:hypothetical protein AAF712_009174 [Marasmius tenuissimus]|uniref:CCHC-type domain-containing protein n=1 Tax=Marasmius tenuissimus TaxID=585030 RepID=A0ABR2ZRZ8_9AGAR|nr:hypothetical protein PM082_024229 [Marasmius tenuissimus]
MTENSNRPRNERDEDHGESDHEAAQRRCQGIGAEARGAARNRNGQGGNGDERDEEVPHDQAGGNEARDAVIERLQRRIRELELVNANPMIARDEEIERAQERAKELADAAKNKPLARPIDGYKANPLLAPVSERVSEAVRQNKYVPLSTIVAHSKNFALRAEEDELVVTKDGMLKARPFDRKGEMNLEFQEHQNAARALVTVTRRHHGDIRADKLEKHFALVSSLAQSHELGIAYTYDIQQRELAAGDERHDLATLDADALTLLTTAAIVSSGGGSNLRNLPGLSTPGKRRFSSAVTDSASVKRARSSCFRCGGTGHITTDCTASTTKAGNQCLQVQKANGKASLVSAAGRQLCFRWTQQSQCRFGGNCTNAHTCSICGSAEHGAAACNQI